MKGRLLDFPVLFLIGLALFSAYSMFLAEPPLKYLGGAIFLGGLLLPALLMLLDNLSIGADLIVGIKRFWRPRTVLATKFIDLLKLLKFREPPRGVKIAKASKRFGMRPSVSTKEGQSVRGTIHSEPFERKVPVAPSRSHLFPKTPVGVEGQEGGLKFRQAYFSEEKETESEQTLENSQLGNHLAVELFTPKKGIKASTQKD